MTLLLYCVLKAPPARPPELTGVGARPVTLLTAGGLAGAFSPVEASHLVPSLPRIVEYERVVEEIFSQRTVVPMRYGSVLAGEREAARYLEEHGARFAALLRELEGCAEMGVRIVVPEGVAQRASAQLKPRPSVRPGAGRAYLDALREHFETSDPLRAAREEAAEWCRRELADLAERHQSEVTAPLGAGSLRLLTPLGEERGREGGAGWRLLASLHFLVKREHLAEFRERSRRAWPQGCRLLVSGPWPPYNFVNR